MTAEPLSVTEIEPTDLSSLGRSLTEHAPVALVMVEGAGHLVGYANPAFCALVNKPKAQLRGKAFSEILRPGHECVAALDRIFRTGKPENHAELQSDKPHPAFWSYTMWPVNVNERPVAIMIQVTEITQLQEKTVAINEALLLSSVRQHELTEAADWANAQLKLEITERHQAQESLQQAQAQLTDRAGQLEGLVARRTKELTATNQQLEAFVYTIAHDLRAPLRSMQGFAAMLVAEAGTTLSAASKDYTDRINKAAHFMDALLIDLLAFSRISQQQVELSPVGLETVFASVLSRLHNDIQVEHATVANAGPWPVVLAHGPTLTQVLFNLVSNALKFVVPGMTPVVRLRVEDKAAEAESCVSTNGAPAARRVRIWVEDNGPGIAPEYHGEIFRLFSRLDGEKHAGTGIGLAIVQKGVERMGGQVGVESGVGQGSRFWFELQRAS